MISPDYVKQLEAANAELQRRLEESHLKLEESNISKKCLELRPNRMITINGYKDIKTVEEFLHYKRKPYPDNTRYPDYMYWVMPFDKRTRRNSDFCFHYMSQMMRYAGVLKSPSVSNCHESWLDDKIMEMPILVLNWYRVFCDRSFFTEDKNDIKDINIDYLKCRRYIIQRGSPEIYYYTNGKSPHITLVKRFQL